MKYAIEMGSGAMIFIPSIINLTSFKRIGSGIQKLLRERNMQTHKHADSKMIS
jgi:hypothetical protein